MSSPFSEVQMSAVLGMSISCGILSTIGSLTIIVILLRSPKKLRSTYRRLLFGMCCWDVLHSLSWVLSGLPVPDTRKMGMTRNAMGNVATCNIQGFMGYAGLLGSVFYDCTLSIYFVLVVVLSKREEDIQKMIEPLFHVVSLIVPVAAGIFLLATEHFNDRGNLCVIASYPPGCDPAYSDKDDEEVECIRGKNAIAYMFYFQMYPLLFGIAIVFMCMLILTCSIRKQSTRMNKYGSNEFAENVERKRRESMKAQPGGSQYKRRRMNSSIGKSNAENKETYKQASLYVMALVSTFIFALIYQTLLRGTYWVYLLQMTFVPLLGFFNFFIYIRPRCILIRQRKPKVSYFGAFVSAVTAKDITPPQRRLSTGRKCRRGSQPFARKRNSPTLMGSCPSTHKVVAAAKSVLEDEKVEVELELEAGHTPPESQSLNDTTAQLDTLPKSRPGVIQLDPVHIILTGNEEERVIEDDILNFSKDYYNML